MCKCVVRKHAYPARSAVGVQWAFSAPTVGLQCALHRTVRPLHFKLGKPFLSPQHTIKSLKEPLELEGGGSIV